MSTPTTKIAVAAAALSDDPRQAPRTARQLGFAGLAFPAVSSAVDLTDLSATGRREFRHLLGSQDQQLAGVWADLGRKGFGPGADIDRALAQLDRVLEAARGLAAPVVCVALGPLPPAPQAAKPKPKVTQGMAGLILLPESMAAPAPEVTSLPNLPPAVDPTFAAQVDAAMLDLGQRADRYGVTVAFRSELAGFAALDRALRRADCPWFGVDLDPVAVLRDEWDADAIFSAVGPLIRHVRARDAVAGAGHRTKPAVIGRGDTNWGEMLARLDEAGYHGWVTVDPLDLPDRATAADAGRKHLATGGR